MACSRVAGSVFRGSFCCLACRFLADSPLSCAIPW
ncbi:Uncharacterised protein [Vibrio cholerae]|nr:Uncharacterised protein [Vibrio cholerae]